MMLVNEASLSETDRILWMVRKMKSEEFLKGNEVAN